MINRLLTTLLTLGIIWIIPNSVFPQIVGNSDPVIIDRILAVVGGYPILQSDVENQYLYVRSEAPNMTGDLKCQIFEGLLQTKLTVNQAEIDSIEVNDAEVESAVKSRLEGMLQQAGGSEQLLIDYFKKSMLEIEKDLHEPIREQLLTQRMMDEVTSSATVTPSEVQRFFKKIPEDEIPLIDETLEIQQIVIKPKVTEDETQRIKDQLLQYREQILAGEITMATLAVLHSEDPGSANLGGELGYLPRGVLDPAYAAQAYNLKPNDISRVVKSSFGYHIIQLIDRKGDLINTRHILLRPKISIEDKIKVKQDLDTIANAIREKRINFERAAAMYSDDEATRANAGLIINPNTASTKFLPKELDAQLMSAITGLEINEISEPFEALDENQNTIFKIISIKSKVPAHRADINKDYQYIQQLALAEKRQKIIDEWVIEKQKSIYVRINKDYRNCDFTYKGWVK